ncbi:cytosine-purine permease [Kockovaella imperatae]|uniref:Cytosine-purine permease n=1 Tax=Kockovaella imperatae TaxID=4999 RepID=A0A1Y1USY7_9TREE|nr:cytosine-purine permease [Kockovaella imperatae]ORX41128.1 cytosine-purine permease [Kockovaella imperatae]
MSGGDHTDVEKGLDPLAGVAVADPGVYAGEHDSALPSDGAWARFDAYNKKLERKLGIESRGIERVPESARPDKHLWGNTMIWLSANTVLPTFGIGILGPLLFYMGLGDSMLTILFFNLVTACIPAYMSTFGPALGLRQMTSSRFSWGFYGAKFVALLNCIACVGWSIINTIAGAQTLEAVAEYKISAAAGVVIIALVTLVLGLFGYKLVHRFERFAWIPSLVSFLVLLGVSAKHLVNVPMPVGRAEAASVLSFGGVIFGFAVGWSSLSSDYNVYMPAESNKWKVFMWTYIGLIFPLVLVQWLGAAVGAAAMVNTDWMAAYTANELGGLLHAVLVPAIGGGGKFFMVILVLSVVANNIINVYSYGLSLSVISIYLAAVPRLVWPCVITAIYIPLAIVGANHFAATLEDFMNVLGYWLAIYCTVVLEEHFIFRKGDHANYNAAETWNRKSLLPVGYAAAASMCFGAAGAAVGMAQVWWTGPIGKAVGGPYGGDLGFELAGAFTAVTFPIFRYFERKYIR